MSKTSKNIEYQALKTLWENTLNDCNDSSSDSSSDSDTDSDEDFSSMPENLLLLLQVQEYLNPRSPVPKSRDWCTNILPRYDDARFRQVVRMSRHAFNIVLENIKSYPAFEHNSDIPIENQLQMTLYRLGRFGNAVSIADVSNLFGVSEGAVTKCTRRVIAAIITLEEKYLRWYTTDEKKNIKKRIHQASGFSKCIGFLDGTAIIFEEKPLKEGELYYNRKSRYAMNCQIICDLDTRIRFLFLGFPGSVHDARCVEESDLYAHPEKYFNDDEYVLADSAYALSRTIITPFKKPASLQPRNAAFNKILSSMRVKVEHCNGILKNRFQSLKGLRLRLKGKKSGEHIGNWVKACAILHNMIIEVDQWDEGETGGNPYTQLAMNVNAENEIDQDIRAVDYREIIKERVLLYNNLS